MVRIDLRMPPSAPQQPPAERRALTLMFCDLVGSTALSARLDPEDLRDVFAAYQRRATEIVEAAGGRVARYEGDGILAYFGYPAASENDPERAVRTGLELARRFGAEVTAGERLKVRIGIASGVVVVGDLLRSAAADNPPIVGETPNLAARLQALAEPGGVVISDVTRRLTGGLFDYRDGGARELAGFPHPVRAWHVIGTRGTTRFRALRSQSLPLIGREAAMATLLDQWGAAEHGRGRAALIVGEPGIGKSRLALELVGQLRRRQATILRFQCSPHHQGSMLYPLLERLQSVASRRQSALPADRAARITAMLGRDAATDAAIALLAELMAVPTTARADAPQPDAQHKRALLFEALIADLRRLALHQPLLLVVEDAHWIDPTSRQLLDLIVDRIGPLAMLLVVTCRPEFEPAWTTKAARIELPPLAAADAVALVRHIPGGDSLDADLVHGIAARADGVPLYVEELTKAVVESAHTASIPRAGSAAVPVIPSSLQASLMARLDRIGQPRETAKIAAALGRNFSFELLNAVAPGDVDALRQEVRRLVAADLIVPVAGHAPETYAFRHALIQDTAYGTLLRNERRALHERIAAALQERSPKIVATQPEVVAGHLTKAEQWGPAARLWLSAGRRAVRGWALTEAAKHLTEGIRVAGLMPPSAERDRLALELHMVLGPVMMGSTGYASEASLEVYRRAEPLVKAAGSASERLKTMLGLFNIHYGRAELAEALAIAVEYKAIATQHGINIGRAHVLLGQTHAAMGAFREAIREFERSIKIYAETPEDTSQLDVFGSQEVVSLALAAGAYYALGRAEEARAAIARSIARANEIEHALSIALARVTDLLTPTPGGLDPDLARAEDVVRFCSERDLKNFEVWARFARGAIIARRGDPHGGIAAMRAAIDAAEGMSSYLFRPSQLGTLASAYARLGQRDKALALVDEALAVSARTGERRADGALSRLRGELLIATGSARRGMQALQQALSVARAQHCIADEVRTATVIARFREAQAAPRQIWAKRLAALRAFISGLRPK